MRIIPTSLRSKFGHATTIAAAGLVLIVGLAAIDSATPAAAQEKKPNILFIMGDDIGWMQVVSYQGGLGLGETPNIDRIANEGARFVSYYAEQSSRQGATLSSPE
jgi:arylsulfatase